MQKLNYALLLMLLFTFTSASAKKEYADYRVIPLPQEITFTSQEPFVMGRGTTILYTKGNELLERNATFLANYLKESTGRSFSTSSIKPGERKNNAIILELDPAISNPEGYELIVTGNHIIISGQTEKGVFYGVQTLRKSVPAVADGTNITFPSAEIKDFPRFGYRGMMLDVCRHMFPVKFIKEYIDILALHNINHFHWHLSDDQGWRIEIKKYPKLTEIGSKRKGTVIGRNSGKYDGKPYGGYYTQKEIKDIIKYAQERYIKVIPEIDLPGHMLAALTAYPHLGCTGGPYEVSQKWGVFEDVLCIGNDDTMKFIEDVLEEVTSLFPSEYIHIGGDEAPRTRWKTCPKCQKRIQDEGLKGDGKHSAEDHLQSYCMQRAEKFLKSKGRRAIGWDEILEGEIAGDAIVMSWRGMAGGIEAAKLGHQVIMAPNSHAYFDYYQTRDTKDEPLSNGSFIDLERVYHLEPVPATLAEDEKKFIIGAQANLWTEYIPTTERVEYQVLPRMAALCEVQWTAPENKDYDDFSKRLPALLEHYKREGYNYAKHFYDLKTSFTRHAESHCLEAELKTVDNATIYYTIDGTDPSQSSKKYEGPFLINQDAHLKAIAIRPDGDNSKIKEEHIYFNKATMRPITLTGAPSSAYTYDGPTALVDGLKGSNTFNDGRWLGFIAHDMEAIIDLGEPTRISEVAACANVDVGSWIMGASRLSIAVSDDNIRFREIGYVDYPPVTDLSKKSIDIYEVTFKPVATRYVKVTLKRSKELPKGHAGEGKPAFLFVDEIIIK